MSDEPATEEMDVSFQPEAEEVIAPTEEMKTEAPEEERDVLDTIVPKKEPRTWEIGPEDFRRTYVQKPLSFIAKMQWFSLVGEVLDKALSGPEGMSLNSLFSTPTRTGELRMQDFRDADTFVQAIGKLLAAAPEFLVDSYIIWLNVPDYDHEVMRTIMKLPPDEGGITDDQGIEIIEVFLDQNYEALADFFTQRISQLQKRVQHLNKIRGSRQSKPSKTTPRTTPTP